MLKYLILFSPDALLMPAYKRVANALADNDVSTEVNVGLKYRYPAKEQYSSEQFVSVLNQHGVLFATSSD